MGTRTLDEGLQHLSRGSGLVFVGLGVLVLGMALSALTGEQGWVMGMGPIAGALLVMAHVISKDIAPVLRALAEMRQESDTQRTDARTSA